MSQYGDSAIDAARSFRRTAELAVPQNGVASVMPLPANALLMTRAERLKGDRARGWYFSVLVRANFARLKGEV